ncbi:MAG: DUF192 domain-containing protein [Candidatus Symbiobacter sp.]|nr:DUF192 domain-containing protein [Candidatus Symbiobacter sp.]
MTWLLCGLAMSLLQPFPATAQDIAVGKKYPLSITGRDGAVKQFMVEHAVTEAEHNQGLMYRTSLPDAGGMIFLYRQPQRVQFWMKNTVIPLDIIFIAAGGKIISIHENAQPLDLTPIASGGAVMAVLELAGGTVARFRITIGDEVRY